MKSKIDYQEIIKLINLLEEKNLTEFELEVEGFRVKIVREKQSTSPPVTTEEASPPPGTETDTRPRPGSGRHP